MNCPHCDVEIPVWRVRYKRKCPACAVELRNEFTNAGYVTLIACMAIAGGIDYYLSTQVVLPRCGHSEVCNFGFGAVTAMLYLVAIYVSAALGACKYTLALPPEGDHS